MIYPRERETTIEVSQDAQPSLFEAREMARNFLDIAYESSTVPREYMRVPFSARVTIAFDGQVLTGEVEDISLKGALVRSSEVLEIGTLVSLTISAPDTSHELSGLKAKVVRVAGGRMGLEFIGYDE